MSGKLRWLGVAFVEFTTSDDRIILFDPWTKSDGNPYCPLETAEILRADLVLVSHDHQDHIASAAEICRKTGALLGGPSGTMRRLISEGLNRDQVVNNGIGYLPGGGAELAWVQVVATPAFHPSDTSCAMGTIVRSSDGTTIYHAGDTSLMMEMQLYSRLYPLDVAILPIGGIGTMDGLQATEAVRLMKPKQVMPIHFNYTPSPDKTLEDFIALCGTEVPDVRIIKPVTGQRMDI